MGDSHGPYATDADELPLRGAKAMAAGLLRTVRVAEALVAAGRTVDLDGIDDLIGRLCARVLDLPPAQGALLTGDLSRLLSEADTLHARLSGRERPSPLPM